jgi:CRISPR-associated protein Csm3
MLSTGKLYGKLIIEGRIACLTGLHIGTSKETLEIGGVDVPVVRNPVTREPYIPGSSIKGKLRALLEKQQFAVQTKEENYFGKNVDKTAHHECNEFHCPVCRLYGASKGGPINSSRPARVYVSDAELLNKDMLEATDMGLYLTELKYENTLDRITSAASPRQIERVPRGAEFKLSLLYNQDEENKSDMFKRDIEAIFSNLLLLKDDALGGSVSRGYGRIDLVGLAVVYRPIKYYMLQAEEKDNSEIRILQKEGEMLKDFFQRALNTLTD